MLTQDQEDILNMGINCHYLTKPRPHRKRLEIKTLLDDIQQLEAKGKVTTSPDLQPSLLAEAAKNRGSFHSQKVKKHHILAAKQLRENNEIVIRRADKTPAFVLIRKEDYDNKINAILNDTTKFKRIGRNPTESLKKRVNATITSINAAKNNLNLQKITGEFSPGYAYGNVKTHKPNNPLRPIISQIPTPTYKIAKRLNQLLTPYVPNTYCLNSSTDFLEILRDAPPEENSIIASLDVESLFTNVPVDKTIGFILDRVYRSSDTTPLDIPEKHLKTLLELCTKEAPFISPDGNLYQQIDGVAMGSPLGVLFANFFMGTIESALLATNRPSIYCRYVDDIFVRIKNLQELETLRHRFISASGLNFTYEESSSGRLPFLDILVTANTSGFKTTVYTKPTNQGLCLSGDSECPKRYLTSTISAYVRRALTHCSTWEETHHELERVTQVLVNNGYSNSDVSQTIKRYLDKWYNRQDTPKEDNTSIQLYYRGYMSTDYRTEEKVMKDIIYKNVKPTNEDTRITLTIYYKTRKTSQLLLRNRPATRKTPLQEDHVIYQHTCNSKECGPCSYIGMTRTTLSRRLTCHLSSGAIKEHYSGRNHNRLTRQDLNENTIILDTEHDPRRLFFLEAIYITTKQPSINIQTENIQILPTLKRRATNQRGDQAPSIP